MPATYAMQRGNQPTRFAANACHHSSTHNQLRWAAHVVRCAAVGRDGAWTGQQCQQDLHVLWLLEHSAAVMGSSTTIYV
jgi:hypothetical protein